MIEKNPDIVESQVDTQDETQEILNVSEDLYSLSTIEPVSRNTTTTGHYGDTTVTYSDKETSSERESAKRKRKVKKEKKASSSDSVRSDNSRASRRHSKLMKEKLVEFEKQKETDRQEMEKLRRELDHVKITMEQRKTSKEERPEIEIIEEVKVVSTESQTTQEIKGNPRSVATQVQDELSQIGDMNSQIGVPQPQIMVQPAQIGEAQSYGQVSQIGDIQDDQVHQSRAINSTTGSSQIGTTQMVSSQPRDPPREGMKSEQFQGLIDNLDGTFTMTKQYVTWYTLENYRKSQKPGL